MLLCVVLPDSVADIHALNGSRIIIALSLCDPAGIPAVAALHRGGGGRRPAAEGGRPGAVAVHQVRAGAGRHQVTEYPCGVCCQEGSNSPLHQLMCALEKCVLYRRAHQLAVCSSRSLRRGVF
jgi:hypothetical protein